MSSVKPQKTPGRKKGKGAPSDEALNQYTWHRLKQLEATKGGDMNDVYRQGGLSPSAFKGLRATGKGIGLNSLGGLARFFGFEHRWEYLRAADEWHAEQLAKNPRKLGALPGWDDASRTLAALDDVTEDELEELGGSLAGFIEPPVTLDDLRSVLKSLRKH
jgi:hypothetical protein